jgi:flavodoxin
MIEINNQANVIDLLTYINKGITYMNILVIFYSYEGNTAFIAKTIAEHLKGDIIRLTPVKEMTSAGFLKYFWGGKQVLMKQCPSLEPFNQDYGKYDYVFVGSPVWAWSFAPAIRTLFEKCGLVDKKIYFFTTSEGGNKKVETRIQELVSKDNQLLGYHDFVNVLKDQDEAVQETRLWLKDIDLG